MTLEILHVRSASHELSPFHPEELKSIRWFLIQKSLHTCDLFSFSFIVLFGGGLSGKEEYRGRSNTVTVHNVPQIGMLWIYAVVQCCLFWTLTITVHWADNNTGDYNNVYMLSIRNMGRQIVLCVQDGSCSLCLPLQHHFIPVYTEFQQLFSTMRFFCNSLQPASVITPWTPWYQQQNS